MDLKVFFLKRKSFLSQSSFLTIDLLRACFLKVLFVCLKERGKKGSSLRMMRAILSKQPLSQRLKCLIHLI